MENILKVNQKENTLNRMDPIIPTPYITLPKQIYQNSTTLKYQNTAHKEDTLSNLNLNISNIHNKTMEALINQSKSLVQQKSESPRFYQSEQKSSSKFSLNQPESTKNKSPGNKNYKSESEIVRDWALNIISKKKLFVKTQINLQRKLTQFKFFAFCKIKQFTQNLPNKNYRSMKSSYQINAISFYMTMQKVQGIQKIDKILRKKVKNQYEQCWRMIKYLSQKQLFVLSNTFNNTMNQEKDLQIKSILKNELELNSFLNSNIEDKQANYKTPYSTTENTRIRQSYQNLKQSGSNNSSKQYRRIPKNIQNNSKDTVHKISNQLYISIKEKSTNKNYLTKNKSEKSLKLNSQIHKGDENSDKDSQCSIQLKQQSNFNSNPKRNKLNSSQNLKERSQISSDNLSALILNMNQIKFEDYCIKTTNQITINNKQGLSTNAQDSNNIQINCHTNVNFSVTIKPESQVQILPIQTKIQMEVNHKNMKPQSPQFLPIDSTTNIFERDLKKNNRQPQFNQNEQRKASHSFDDRLKFSFCPKSQNLLKNPFEQLQQGKKEIRQKSPNRINFQINSSRQPTQSNCNKSRKDRAVSFNNCVIQRCASTPKITFNFVNQQQTSKNLINVKTINKQIQHRPNLEYYNKSPQHYQGAQIKVKNSGLIHVQQKNFRSNYFLQNNPSAFSNYVSPISHYSSNQINYPGNSKMQTCYMSSPYFNSIKSSTHFNNNYQNLRVEQPSKNRMNGLNQNYGLQNVHKKQKNLGKVPNLASKIETNNFRNNNYQTNFTNNNNINNKAYYQYQNASNQKQPNINKQLTRMKNSKEKILVTSSHKYKYT